MARSRRSKRYYRRKGKWSANIEEIAGIVLTFNPGLSSGTTKLATNPVQSNTTVSQIYTIKNMELTFSLEESSNGSIEGVTAYIMYVPQGMNVGPDYNIQHPEYIMTYKFIGSPSQDINTGQATPIKVRTRLARRLQTGDSIILFIKALNQDTVNRTANLNGLIRWWTKAN